MQLDYNINTTEERIDYVNKILKDLPQDKHTNKNLNFLSDYILFISDKDQTKKERKQEKPIITRNREMTIQKRQISYEGMAESLESGEDGLYNLIYEDKNQLLDAKTKITQEDIDNVPGLREQFEIIEKLKKQFERATTGAQRYSIKKQIIESYQQIYILRASFYNTIARNSSSQIKTMAHMQIDENIWLDENDNPQSDSILTLINPAHVSFLLCYYSHLKQECVDDFDSDMRFLLMDLEHLASAALEEKHPELYDLLIWKIDGCTGEEIQDLMQKKYGIEHSPTYYSTVWRKKIPTLISNEAKKQFLIWYFTNVEYGSWKKCSKCGEIKLAHNMFFAKNSTRDGWYSMCKDCKNGRS